MPGAPVTELEYKHYMIMPYSKRRIWRHISESGWYHEYTNLVPKTDYSLGGGIFFIGAGNTAYIQQKVHKSDCLNNYLGKIIRNRKELNIL